jgi:phosphohistidine phosphatase
MMKTLLLMRHAKSSWKDDSLADHDRPLNKRGRRDAPRMGRLLRERDLVPDLILSSTAERASATAGLVAEAAGYSAAVQISEDLYHVGAVALLQVICQIDERFVRPLVIGHNPAMADLLEQLTGDSHSFPTAALACLKLDVPHWRDIERAATAKLVDFWHPRELP